MKVLHISTGSAGAGMCAEKIHYSLINEGVESRMLVFSPPKNKDVTIDAPYQIKKGILSLLFRIIRKLFRYMSIAILEEDRFVLDNHKYKAFYSTPCASLDITSHPWIEWADIIHLHWCNNFFNQPLFFEKIKEKPIVWTLHDENFFYGTAHYHDAILYNDKLERKYRKIKEAMITNADNLCIVLLSEYFVKNFSDSILLKNKKVRLINNAVDTSTFVLQDQTTAREKIGLPQNKKIILFVATNISDKHKGLNILSKAVEKIQDMEIQIIAIGGKDGYIEKKNITAIGKIYDPQLLSLYYSAADIYALPSLQEGFSQSVIEALSCGTPVVAFPVGGACDCVNINNGYLCDDYTTDELVKGINSILKNSYDRQSIRNSISERFSSEYIAKQYIELYKELLENRKKTYHQ